MLTCCRDGGCRLRHCYSRVFVQLDVVVVAISIVAKIELLLFSCNAIFRRFGAVVVADGTGGSSSSGSRRQVFSPAQVNDFIVFGLEVKRKVAALAPQATQSALQGSSQVLYLLAVVDRQEIATHFRILRL